MAFLMAHLPRDRMMPPPMSPSARRGRRRQQPGPFLRGGGTAGSSSSSNNNNNKQQHVILRRVASATGVGMMLRAMVLTPTRQLDNNLATGSCGVSPLPPPTSDDNYPFTAPAQSRASPPVTTPSPLAVLSRRHHRQTPVRGHATAFTRLRRIGRILRKRKSELPAEKSME